MEVAYQRDEEAATRSKPWKSWPTGRHSFFTGPRRKRRAIYERVILERNFNETKEFHPTYNPTDS